VPLALGSVEQQQVKNLLEIEIRIPNHQAFKI
jgi:hypothetical protein